MPEPISYTLRFPAPQTHYVEVDGVFPTEGADEVELFMAVWTPGSYLVREYSRHVEGVTATTVAGAPLPVAKSAKNRWRVGAGGASSVAVRYRVYSREMTVRTNWVDDRVAILNGAPTFLTLADARQRAHQIAVELPRGWTRSVSPLPRAPGADRDRYCAADFDALVDSPLLVGSPVVHELDVGGARYVVATVGDAGVWDGDRAASDVRRIAEAMHEFWRATPFDRYVLFNILSEGAGGLEHANSALIMASRWATRSPSAYLRWLGLVSHELFHAWNVKRLRPAELGPFDYQGENYTPSLWVAEGLTDYYGDLLVRRAGLSTRDEFLETLSRSIRTLQTTPGRLVTPLAQASFDAWIKQYRADENSANSSISYYTKGGVVALLLDARIRRATEGARSLDDVMRLAYARYSGARGFTPEEFQATISEVAGTDLSPWLHHAIATTGELDYSEMLDWYGLRFRPESPAEAVRRLGRVWLGVEVAADAGRLLVTRVIRDTPAHDAGLAVDDELIAIDDLRVRAGALDDRLARYRPGERVSMLVARRDELRRLDVTLGTDPGDSWRLEPAPDAPADRRRNLEALEGGN